MLTTYGGKGSVFLISLVLNIFSNSCKYINFDQNMAPELAQSQMRPLTDPKPPASGKARYL